jgi:SPP1 gp7 family putative phage head morphogenesis protein
MNCSQHQSSVCGCSVNWDKAQLAADEILKDVFRIDIAKALNPLDDDDFLIIAHTIAAEMQEATGPFDVAAYEAAILGLDLDWENMTGVEIAAAMSAANKGLASVSTKVLPVIRPKLSAAMQLLIASTRIYANSTYDLGISTSFSQTDEMVSKVLTSISTWVTDEYGKRHAMFESGVEKIIQDGLLKGLRSEEIAADIAEHGVKIGIKQPKNYWRLVSMNMANQARSYANLKSMQEAGIKGYVFEAVMDERTSNICESLHGTVFPVSVGLGAYSDLSMLTAGDPYAAEKIMPFVRERKTENGDLEMYVLQQGSGETVVSTLESGGARRTLSPSELAAAGVVVPPIHHACRSTIIPDI